MDNKVIHVRYTFADKVKGIRKIHQSESKLKYGKFYTKTDFVCTHENGKPVSSDDMRYFGQYCKKVL